MKSANICKSGSVCLIANARLLGSAQGDAIRNITGRFRARVIEQHAIIQEQSGAFTSQGLADPNLIGARDAQTSEYKGSSWTGFDASRVVPTSTENRSVNTAFAPRIIAY